MAFLQTIDLTIWIVVYNYQFFLSFLHKAILCVEIITRSREGFITLPKARLHTLREIANLFSACGNGREKEGL
jgi:hypothetical protein